MEKKYQWSAMYGGNQYVIRMDDEAEFDRAVAKYEKMVADKKSPPMNTIDEKVSNFVAEYESDAKKCPVHNASMIDGKSKKPPYKPYSYHDGDNGEGRCFGRGFLPPKA